MTDPDPRVTGQPGTTANEIIFQGVRFVRERERLATMAMVLLAERDRREKLYPGQLIKDWESLRDAFIAEWEEP